MEAKLMKIFAMLMLFSLCNRGTPSFIFTAFIRIGKIIQC